MNDYDELKKWWDLFVGKGSFTEVRILGRFQYSGYFKDFDNLARQIEPYTKMDDEQIYFVLNKIDDACYARPQCEKFVKSVKVSTNDNDIVGRKFVMIDCDPIRKASVNSSDFEFQCAHKKAQEIFRFLRGKGFNDPIVCVSGNGMHLQYLVDLPANDEITKILRGFYKFLGQQFTDEHVDIDQKVYNLARLCKVYSTYAKKGANVPDRPWRQSRILYVPDALNITPIEKFKELADLVPDEPKPITTNNFGSSQRFDLENWLRSHGVEYRAKQDGNSTKYEIKDCPWKDSHSSNNPYSSAIYQDYDGKIKYTCAHSHCADKQWKDFRLFYEPDAYNHQQYQYRQAIYNQPQKPRYQVKEQLPELGNKWLCMSDIKKVDLSQIESVKTGFTELDTAIVGLHMSEVTVLSGSNASGKSSWLNTLLLNIVQQGYKIALWSGELRPDILKTWIQMVAAGKDYLQPSKINAGKYFVPNNIGQLIDNWLDGKFFLYNNEYGTKWEQIFNDMGELLKAGVKVFALDNLFTLDIDLFDGDKNNKQKELILQIKDFAKKNQVHIILVAHPRKVMTFLRKNDISGTSDITNAVDNVFIIHRVNEDFLHAIKEFFGAQAASRFNDFGNVVAVEKNRMYGAADVMCGMMYETESRRFKNTMQENIVYGWLEQPKQEYISIPQSVDDLNVDLLFGEQADDAPF